MPLAHLADDLHITDSGQMAIQTQAPLRQSDFTLLGCGRIGWTLDARAVNRTANRRWQPRSNRSSSGRTRSRGSYTRG